LGENSKNCILIFFGRKFLNQTQQKNLPQNHDLIKPLKTPLTNPLFQQHRLQSQQPQQLPSTSSNLMSIPSLTACSSPSALQLGQQNQQPQQFHSPDSGFTESGSLFSAIQRPATGQVGVCELIF
jgi:hypothetical protein